MNTNIKKIVNICTGGLGNRLKPLSSSYTLAKNANRELMMIWEKNRWCDAFFHDLFQNDISETTLQWIMTNSHISFYANADDVVNYYDFLIPVFKRFGCKPIDYATMSKDESELILVISNDYFKNVEANYCKEFFNWLRINPLVEERVATIEQELKLDKSYIGVHARGTDFETGGVTVQTYIEKMNHEFQKNNDVKFFVCSDTPEYERQIKNIFKNAYFNTKQNFVAKIDQKSNWSNNINRSVQAVQDALVDMLLLSKTNFKIYHSESTFAHIVEMLSTGTIIRNNTKHSSKLLHRIKSLVKQTLKKIFVTL